MLNACSMYLQCFNFMGCPKFPLVALVFIRLFCALTSSLWQYKFNQHEAPTGIWLTEFWMAFAHDPGNANIGAPYVYVCAYGFNAKIIMVKKIYWLYGIIYCIPPVISTILRPILSFFFFFSYCCLDYFIRYKFLFILLWFIL